jgi:hypothetical protein
MAIAHGLIQLGFTPEIDFELHDDGYGGYIKVWNSKLPQPSEAEITKADTEWQAEYDAQEYARNRATSYPSTGDQLDYIYHNGVAKWKTDMIDPVKTKYPKE